MNVDTLSANFEPGMTMTSSRSFSDDFKQDAVAQIDARGCLAKRDPGAARFDVTPVAHQSATGIMG